MTKTLLFILMDIHTVQLWDFLQFGRIRHDCLGSDISLSSQPFPHLCTWFSFMTMSQNKSQTTVLKI